MIRKFHTIGVMGSHESEWLEYSEPLGVLLAEEGFNLLTGAGAGVMQAVSKAFTGVRNRDGKSIGIIPTINYSGEAIDKDKYPNAYIEIPVLVPLDNRAQSDSMPYSRNQVNIMSSDVLVVLPGDHGTRNEVSIALIYNKPIILFGDKVEFEGFPEAPFRAAHINDVKDFIRKKLNRHE